MRVNSGAGIICRPSSRTRVVCLFSTTAPAAPMSEISKRALRWRLHWSGRMKPTSSTWIGPKGVTVNWSGGSPNSYVEISGYDQVINDMSNTSTPLSELSAQRLSLAWRRFRPKQFTVPSAVLLALPPAPSSGVNGSLSIANHTNASDSRQQGWMWASRRERQCQYFRDLPMTAQAAFEAEGIPVHSYPG